MRFIYLPFFIALALISHSSVVHAQCTVQGNQLSALWNNMTRNFHDEISLQTNFSFLPSPQRNLIRSNFLSVQNGIAPAIATIILPTNPQDITNAIINYYIAGQLFLTEVVQGLPTPLDESFVQAWRQAGQFVAFLITIALNPQSQTVDPTLNQLIQDLITIQRNEIVQYFLDGDLYLAGLESSFLAFILSNQIGQRIGFLQLQ